MTIDENGNIQIYNGDYGVPITFDTEDLSVGDKIVFVIAGNPIPAKTFVVDSDNYSFELVFNEEESRSIAAAAGCVPIGYSFKQYRDNTLLDTVLNGKIEIKGTVQWRR